MLETRIVKLIITLLLLGIFPSPAWTNQTEEQLKAKWLGRFAGYVNVNEPGEKMAESSKRFTVGIIGKTPLIFHLGDEYGTKNIMNKQVTIKYFAGTQDIKEIETCHIVFISASVSKNLAEIISDIKNKPILTVADTPGFAEKGVHINFYREGLKLRFEINSDAIREAKLFCSAILLRIGKKVATLRNTR
ncbi:MAG: YfiR family protein [bacterium]|nr:YfiR family protein [bacterium]